MKYLWAVMNGNVFLAAFESDDPDFVSISWPNDPFTGIDIKGIETIPNYGDIYDADTATFSAPPPPPPPPPPTPQEQIDALERTCTPRRLREAFIDPAWMLDLEAQIVALRIQIPTT